MITKNKIGLILGPIVFFLIKLFYEPANLSDEGLAILASTTWVAIWWMTEAVPIYVTSLIPIILFPLSGGLDLKITTARFANVAFSNGSLLEGFINRLQKQQPISCPADVKRFFVSPEESGQICMLACILGETGDIFYPKLAEEKMVSS